MKIADRGQEEALRRDRRLPRPLHEVRVERQIARSKADRTAALEQRVVLGHAQRIAPVQIASDPGSAQLRLPCRGDDTAVELRAASRAVRKATYPARRLDVAVDDGARQREKDHAAHDVSDALAVLQAWLHAPFEI